MPEGKICPFFLIFYKEKQHLCIESQCQLWYPAGERCSILAIPEGIYAIADQLVKLNEILDSKDIL